MKAQSNQLVCIGHRTPTIASAGRMLIDDRTGELLNRNAMGQPRLHPLAMLELFEQLKSHGAGQMTLTSPKMSTYLVNPTSNHFCQGTPHQTLSIFFPPASRRLCVCNAFFFARTTWAPPQTVRAYHELGCRAELHMCYLPHGSTPCAGFHTISHLNCQRRSKCLDGHAAGSVGMWKGDGSLCNEDMCSTISALCRVFQLRQFMRFGCL